MNRRPNLSAAVLWILVAGTGSGAAGTPAQLIALRSSVQVQAESIRLSDLLPPAAPGEVRQQAAEIVLGHAPQPGRRRILSSHYVLGRLTAFPELLSSLEIPPEIRVVRANRPLTSEDILPALRRALTRFGCTPLLSVEQGQVELSAIVRVTEDSAELEVEGIEIDSLLRRVRFRLRLSNQGPGGPFYAVMPLTNPVLAMLGASETDGEEAIDSVRIPADPVCRELAPRRVARRASPREIERPPPRPPILARAGRRAILQVAGPDLRVRIHVIPLEHGRQGEEIRLRNVGTKQIIKGVVVGQDLLESAF